MQLSSHIYSEASNILGKNKIHDNLLTLLEVVANAKYKQRT